MTYSQWYELYIQLYKKKLAEKTRESYKRLHELVAPVLGVKELAAITPDDIQMTILVAEAKSGSRQAQLVYTQLHAVFRRAVRSKHLKENPVDAIDKPEHVSKQGHALEGKDWNILQPVINQNAAYALMCYAGLRRGETLGLRRADVDLEEGIIRVCRQRVRVGGKIVTSEPKSSAGIRIVPIAPELIPILSNAMRSLLPNAFIIPVAPETLEHRWKRDQQNAGIMQPYRLHDLRHTYATRLVLDGINLRVLQYVIGHADYQLTLSTYTHINASDAKTELLRVYTTLH